MKKGQEILLEKYQQKGEKIIDTMLEIVLRAQRKVDDLKYRQTLEKLKK